MQYIQTGISHALFNNGIYFVFSTFDGLDDFVVVGAFEGEGAMEHAIEDYSCGPDIYTAIALIGLIIGEALWSHVGQTTSVEVFLLEETDCSSYSEVDNLDFILLRVDQEHVLQFKISMNQIIEMAVPHSFDDLLKKHLGGLFVKSSLLLDHLQ